MDNFLAREGQITLDQATTLVSSGPSLFGINDEAVVRSVLVQREDGRWVNHCTILRLGEQIEPPSAVTEDRHVGGARLVGAHLMASSIVSPTRLIEALTTWRLALTEGEIVALEETVLGRDVVERPWDFQESGNLHHRASNNPWGKNPCWMIDLYDRVGTGRGFSGPRGPFREREGGSKIFAPDLGTLTKNWCGDPSWKDGDTVQDSYRIIIPDRRGSIDKVIRRRRELIVTISGPLASEVRCVSWDREGNDTQDSRPIIGGKATFNLPKSATQFELYVFDESDAWCDRSRRMDLKDVVDKQRAPRALSRESAEQQRTITTSVHATTRVQGKVYGDQWEVAEQLGEGGQGVAYKVRDLRRPSAGYFVLKRLKNPKRFARFQREIETAVSLEHPNIIRIYDSNLKSEPYYLVSEYCQSGSLEEASPFWKDNPIKALMLFSEVCAGVAYAHSQGVIHRDLKPANILLRGPEGPPVVADFGICFQQDGSVERLTDTVEAVGPRLFIAPELEDGRLDRISSRADSYSLGKVLYWLVSGGRVFSREKHRNVEWDVKTRDNDNMTGWKDIFVEHVNEILDLAIQPDPEQRREAGNLGTLARHAARLIGERRYPLAEGVPHPCSYCGRGVYALRVEGTPNQVSNFGFAPVSGAEWRVFACTYCGHVQIFRTDFATYRKPWGNRA